MRDIIELLIMLRDHICLCEEDYFTSDYKLKIGINLDSNFSYEKSFNGMCNSAGKLLHNKVISHEEYRELMKFINVNRPLKTSKGTSVYWWKPIIRQPRLDWLDQKINEISKG